MSHTPLLIFAKHPTPGQVMTRLCPPLTHEDAAAVQRACIRLLCERAFRSWPVRPTLVITPDDSEAAFREFVGPFVPIRPQGGGDLGDRLQRSAAAAIADGAPHVVVIGADSPTMPAERLEDARRAMEKADAVIGPSDDGGFYLLGLRRIAEGLFSGIEWGSDRVARQTRDRAESHGLSVAEIGAWYDIDRPADLERALADMRDAKLGDDYELRKVIENVLAATKQRETKAKS